MFQIIADTSNHNLPIGATVYPTAAPDWAQDTDWYTQDNPESAVSIARADLVPLVSSNETADPDRC